MNIFVRLISIALIIAGAYLISDFSLDLAEPNETWIEIVFFGILFSCILHFGLFLSTTSIGSRHRVKTAIAMLPGAFLYFGGTNSHQERQLSGRQKL